VTEISATLVKELREATGAGMMDCKRALQDTEGDLDAARTLLREKGMAQAGKRADRATTEGLVGTIVESGVGTIVGIGPEYAELLEAAGVDSVPELAQRNVENLVTALTETNDARSLVRQVPSAAEVADWIEQAKALPRVVAH